VPAISVTGAPTIGSASGRFSFPQGSMTDEPIFLVDLVAKRGLTEIGVLVEQQPHRRELSEEPAKRVPPQRHSESSRKSRSPRQRRTSTRPCRPCTRRSAEAIVHLGFGFGIVFHHPGARERRLGPAAVYHYRLPETRGSTRSCGTRSWAGSGSISTTRANPIGQRASWTSTAAKYKRQSSRVLRDGGEP